MAQRQEFQMTDAQLAVIVAASTPTPLMFLPGGLPMFDCAQQNANRAWERLADQLGFEPYTVRPSKKGNHYFTAHPKEDV